DNGGRKRDADDRADEEADPRRAEKPAEKRPDEHRKHQAAQQQAGGGAERVRRRGGCGGHRDREHTTLLVTVDFGSASGIVSTFVAAVKRIVLVHGSVVGGRATWREQRRAGVEGAELIVLERPGFPPRPPEDVDFDDQADWLVEQLRESDHLVGHSYGGVVALLAAARRGRGLGSLTVIEPPCTRVALDHPVLASFAPGRPAPH